MIIRAILRQGTVTLTFHSEAPIEVEQLVALVQRGKGRYRLSADFQLSFTPHHTDWDGLVQEIQDVLREVQQPLPAPAQPAAAPGR
jgi:hypothetical protein